MKGVSNVFLYLDDILVFAKSKAEHDATIRLVFEKLAANNMALSLNKCKFNKTEVEYLGYQVTSTGIRPLPKKLEALNEFKNPTCQKDILHFCGALNYFRSSLKGLKEGDKWRSAAEILQPLYAIGTEKLPPKLKFEEVWKDSPALQKAFQDAKRMLINATELVHPNPNYPLALFTDASDHSVGGALTMLAPDGKYHPLGFYSAHLNPTQKKYSVFKKELLGVHKSLRHFLPEICGKHCTIFSDHLPLQNAFNMNSDKIPLNDPQVYRQLTEIGRFTRDIRHVSGADNVCADFLSRIREENQGTEYLEGQEEPPLELAMAETVRFQVFTVNALEELQKKCPEIKRILNGDQPKQTVFGYADFGGIKLFCEKTARPRPYVPLELRQEVIKNLHSVGHPGIKTSIKRVAEEYYWPSIKHDITNFCKMCVSCKKAKPGKKLINSGEFQVPDKRFSHVMLDIVGPLPPSYGQKFLLTAICRTTRMVQAIPLPEATASAAAAGFLHHWAALFGIPALVTSDNGASFTAGIWKDMMSKLNVDVKYSALYRPQSIGMLERQHLDIKTSLKAALIDIGEKHQDKWLDFLPFVLLGKRVSYQQDIGASPSELAFGMNVRIPGQILYDPGQMPDGPKLQEILRDVRTKTNRDPVQTSNHSRTETILEGLPDNVTHVFTRQHQTTGLQAPYEGPFPIESRVSKSVIKIIVGQYRNGENRYEYRHINDVKSAHPDSMAAPASRPALGRPSSSTDAKITGPPNSGEMPSNRLTISNPQPSDQNIATRQNKQAVATHEDESHATSITENDNPPCQRDEPAKIQTASGRPHRSTRNPNPIYVDMLERATGPPSVAPFHKPGAWAASGEELAELNRFINTRQTG